MLKASSLYIVIVVSLIITIILASLIATGYFYRLEYQKNQRFNRLITNLSSGINITLSKHYKEYDTEQIIDLFGDQTDSISLNRERWGAFDLAVVKAFSLNDTIKKAFLIGRDIQSDQSALYLCDEDRPLTLTGEARITGDAYLPTAGIFVKSYIDGSPYTGQKLVYGKIKVSKRILPDLDTVLIDDIKKMLSKDVRGKKMRLPDSLVNSFYNAPLIIRINPLNAVIKNQSLHGKIILLCDTVLQISNTASLKDVIIYANAVVLEAGFKGSCQLFARDSIVLGKKSVVNYPSCFGVLKPDSSKIQAKVRIDSGAVFSGVLFSFERQRSYLQTIVSLGQNSLVKGEVHATGFLKMDRPLKVEGKVSCNRFLMQTTNILYENFLIDVTIDRTKLNRYYLSSILFADKKMKKAVISWLN